MGRVGSSLLRVTASGLYKARLLGPLSRAIGYMRAMPTYPILSYHRVNDDADPFFPSLASDVFERHVAFVARTYAVFTVEELVERSQRGTLPRNALAITFDDGYRDNLTHAAPILARYGLAATVFLVTGAIGGGEALWFDRLAFAFRQTRATAWRSPWDGVLALDTVERRLAALSAALAHLKRLPDADRRRAIDGIVLALGVGDERALKNLMLSWDDVQALVGLGFGIGAHTVTHPILSRLSADEARAEVVQSGRMVEAALGRRTRAFAYPNGHAADYGQAVAAMVREAGFTCAVTTRFGVNTAATSPYELRRGGPWEHHVPTFALKLAAYRLSEA
jgi:peptidoglycan/xylan/chitin deacetylase (PgdA/CDA1 family)